MLFEPFFVKPTLETKAAGIRMLISHSLGDQL